MRAAARPRLNLSLEGNLDKALKSARLRLRALFCVIIITLLFISGKTVQLTFFYEPETIKRLTTTKLAREKIQTNAATKKDKLRKATYDRNGILISSNLITSSLYANPRTMLDAKEAAKQLSIALPDLNRAELEKKLSDKTKSFVWIKRNLHPRQKYEVNALGIPGVMFEEEEKRIYPHGRLFSHAIGMVGQDGHGLSGLERFLDNMDSNVFDQVLSENNINTTLDIRLQTILREELQYVKDHHKAASVGGVIMEANSGEIMAMVSLPDYDPNLPRNLTKSGLFNTVTQGSYELGSVFKPLTFAAAMDIGAINEKMIFDASEPIQIGRFRISDFMGKKRPLSVPEGLMYSSNIVTAKIAEIIGIKRLQEYYKRLGLFNRLDVEVTERAMPTIPKHWSQVNLFTASYGHGLAVTPLHVAAAFAAVVNGGLYHQPTLVMRTEEQELTKPSRVFSKKTSERMRDLVRLVVVNGSGKSANAEGYMVGGKTGTADKIDERGRYAKDKVVSTFVSAFPMDAPKYIVLITADDPKAAPDTYGYATAGWVAAPAAGKVIKRIAPILRVQPRNDDAEQIMSKFNIVKN